MNVITSVNNIRDELIAGRILTVWGTGLTAAATRSPLASWSGLIEDAITQCVTLGRRDDTWAARAKDDANSPYDTDLIAAAEKATDGLGGRTGAEFSHWLYNSVGSLNTAHPEVPEAAANLAEAGALIATTNYDDILEVATGYPPVTWRHNDRMRRIARGRERGIIHIHGHWSDPTSVVFGASSYADVISDRSAATFLQTALYAQTVVFIGFGAGLSDPNFNAIRSWMRDRLGDGLTHYRLCRTSELDAVTAEHQHEPITAVPYGDDHADLAPFLNSLARTGSVSTPMRGLDITTGAPASTEPATPNPSGSHIPLPEPEPDPADLRILDTHSRYLEDAVRLVGDRDPDVDDDPRLEELSRFFGLFGNEVRSVLEADADHADLTPDQATIAARWAQRLTAMLGPIPDERSGT